MARLLYTCAIIDLYDRSIVDYANSSSMDNLLVAQALENSLKNEKVKNNLILHSDQVNQFKSKYFTDYCKSKNIIQSMSKDCCPYDNALIDIFFNTLKSEFIHLNRSLSLERLNSAMSYYINV